MITKTGFKTQTSQFTVQFANYQTTTSSVNLLMKDFPSLIDSHSNF